MSMKRVLVACAASLGLTGEIHGAQDQPQPTAWVTSVKPLDAVERLVMPPVDVEALQAEDARHLAETGQLVMRYAASLEVDVSPETAGTWERVAGGELLWRLRVYSKGARSLNFAFDDFVMPPAARLFIYSADHAHVYRPFTAADNEDHGQLWTPAVFGEEAVLELTLPEGARTTLRLHLQLVNHDYRGLGQQGFAPDSGGCNIDVVCPIGASYDNQDRAVSVISVNGSLFCSGSLVNNTAGDGRAFFITAQHCGITTSSAPSVVAYWNYFNSTCRPQSPGPQAGDGSLAQFNTGVILRAESGATDMTFVEMDDPLPPSFNLFLAGWDRTPAPTQFTSTAGIHHPLIREMRIALAPGTTIDASWPPSAPPDGTHIRALWGSNLGTVEPGSSGSPLYTQQGRFIGHLRGGTVGCGPFAPAGHYGRLSQTWATPTVAALLDPLGTGQLTIDGLNACAQPPAPGGVTATATTSNTIRVAWSPVAGAAGYDVFRAQGACPQTTFSRIAANLATTTYDDGTASGGTTYSYVVRSVAVSGCASEKSNCAEAMATGGCTLPPTFGGANPLTQPVPGVCRLDVSWTAGAPSCGATLRYNVYRSTDPAFVPGPSNLLQSCVMGVTVADTTVSAGNSYYYVVRAEDGMTGGSGPCNGGNEDANLVRRLGDPDLVNVFFDDVESGPGLWAIDDTGPGDPWTVVANQGTSPSHSWFVDDPSFVTDQRLAFASPVMIPVGTPVLTFSEQHDMEAATPTVGYDGGVLEYSPDGTAWFDILDGNGGAIPANPNRITANPYRTAPLQCCSNPLSSRRAWSGVSFGWVTTRVDLSDFSGHSIRLRWRRGTDDSTADVGWWIDDVRITRRQACGMTQSVAASALVVDESGNRVLQPGEAAVVLKPTWRNTSPIAIASLDGVLGTFTGPTGATYAINDRSATYGALVGNGSGDCGSNCYAVTVTAATRPATHWDATALETVSINQTAKAWTVHVGDSFVDVPPGPFYRFVEILLHRGVTGGCTATTYCPGGSTTREAMAVFVLLAKDRNANPPACVAGSEAFADVPASSPFCRWIEELARRSVAGGCGGANYCPQGPVSREQMAVFVLRTLDPTLNPPPCGTTPMFNDLPASSPFCRWVEELARRAVVSGCGNGNYCPAAPVTREQMGVFLTVTFGLALYGV